jgi:hypothetical protein
MSEPREYQIVQSLQAALQAISVAGGYYFDVVATAVKLDPNQDVEDLIAPGGPRPFVVLELKPDTWEYTPAGQLRLAVKLAVHWVSDSTPTDDASRLQTFFRGCADVERAIALDISRGGLAVDTRITGRTLDLAVDGAQVWAVLDVEILTRRTYGSP